MATVTNAAAIPDRVLEARHRESRSLYNRYAPKTKSVRVHISLQLFGGQTFRLSILTTHVLAASTAPPIGAESESRLHKTKHSTYLFLISYVHKTTVDPIPRAGY